MHVDDAVLSLDVISVSQMSDNQILTLTQTVTLTYIVAYKVFYTYTYSTKCLDATS